MRLLARAARAERPQRLPPLRPPDAGGRALIARLGALTLLLVALALGACGGDDEPSAGTAPEAPELTIPETDPAPEPPPETEAPPTTETTPPATDGGTAAPDTPTETTPDTPQNDTPPPEDSPAERFEEFCNDNPGACG